PMVRRRDGDEVNFLILKQLADVRVALDGFARVGASLRFPFQHVLVYVAKRDQAHPLEFAETPDVGRAASAETDDGHTDIVVGSKHAGSGQQAERGGGES